jgi:SAM-dependent methyltransferase
MPLISRVGQRARRQMYDLFLESLRPTADSRILDIGVTCDTVFPESNYLEKAYPHKDQIVCVGTEDGSHLEQLYPGLRFLRVRPGEPLPFRDGEFDIVYSNAVVEHAGPTEQQRAFIREACRVGRQFFITTPNRWFPVEHHTGLPFLHWLPKALWHRSLRVTRHQHWASAETLNILTAGRLRALFPAGCPVRIQRAGIVLGPFSSNLVAYSNSTAKPLIADKEGSGAAPPGKA